MRKKYVRVKRKRRLTLDFGGKAFNGQFGTVGDVRQVLVEVEQVWIVFLQKLYEVMEEGELLIFAPAFGELKNYETTH